MASQPTGGRYILREAVAHHRHLFGAQAQGFDSKLEDTRVRFANSNQGRLDDLQKQAIQTKLTKHRRHITIKVTHQHLRSFQLLQHLPTVDSMLSYRLIDPIKQRSTIGLMANLLQLDAQLLAQCLVEGKIALDDRLTTQHSLCKDVSIAKLLLVNRHACLLPKAPKHTSPMVTTRIKSASIVKNPRARSFIIHSIIRSIIRFAIASEASSRQALKLGQSFKSISTGVPSACTIQSPPYTSSPANRAARSACS